MASVVDDQTEVERSGKVDGELDLSNVGDVDRVSWEAPHCAVSTESGVAGLAGGTLELRRHDRGGIRDTVKD